MHRIRVPVSAKSWNGHKHQPLADLAKPHRMFDVDEEFDPPATFFKNSMIPAPSCIRTLDDRSKEICGGQLPRVDVHLPVRYSSINVRPSFSMQLKRSRLSNLTNYCLARNLHGCMKVPDFDYYRKEEFKDPRRETVGDPRRRPYGLSGPFWAAGVAMGSLVKGVANTLGNFVMPSKSAVAMSVGEYNVAAVEPGQTITEIWQGKPIFIHRWTDEEIKREQATDLSLLRDPQTVEQRCTNPEWLVCVGVCTHLGCVPIPGQGDYEGFFCPCHASHYDMCGRVRKGPAPRNLDVPKHFFENENTLVVGES